MSAGAAPTARHAGARTAGCAVVLRPQRVVTAHVKPASRTSRHRLRAIVVGAARSDRRTRAAAHAAGRLDHVACEPWISARASLRRHARQDRMGHRMGADREAEAPQGMHFVPAQHDALLSRPLVGRSEAPPAARPLGGARSSGRRLEPLQRRPERRRAARPSSRAAGARPRERAIAGAAGRLKARARRSNHGLSGVPM